jgi:hypothetical protein
VFYALCDGKNVRKDHPVQKLVFDITMVIGPDTDSEREIIYDDNRGNGFTQDEAFDRLDELKSIFGKCWPGTTRFSLVLRDSPSAQPAARQKRPAVDWSRMRPLLPSKQPPVAQQGGFLELDEEDEKDEWSM